MVLGGASVRCDGSIVRLHRETGGVGKSVAKKCAAGLQDIGRWLPVGIKAPLDEGKHVYISQAFAITVTVRMKRGNFLFIVVSFPLSCIPPIFQVIEEELFSAFCSSPAPRAWLLAAPAFDSLRLRAGCNIDMEV